MIRPLFGARSGRSGPIGDNRSRDATLLELRDLSVGFATASGELTAVRDVDLMVRSGESLGIVGESGSGKSALLLAILGLHPRGTRIDGSVRFDGQEIAHMSDREMQHVRGNQIGLVYQDPMAALNPTRTIGAQIREPLKVHLRMSRRTADERATELLERVGIPNARRQLTAYPHEFSGGMRQRIVIAMALAAEPALLLADEPTTALDVSVQAQVVDLLAELTRELGIALVLVSHDLGLVSGIADRVAVMYAGRIVEEADAIPLYETPWHPYTAALLGTVGNARGLGPDDDIPTIPGAPPDLRRLPNGCAFAPRCAYAEPDCREQVPAVDSQHGRRVACLHPRGGPLAEVIGQ